MVDRCVCEVVGASSAERSRAAFGSSQHRATTARKRIFTCKNDGHAVQVGLSGKFDMSVIAKWDGNDFWSLVVRSYSLLMLFIFGYVRTVPRTSPSADCSELKDMILM